MINSKLIDNQVDSLIRTGFHNYNIDKMGWDWHSGCKFYCFFLI
jgi:rhamnogalacturonyl hydrolase YesR